MSAPPLGSPAFGPDAPAWTWARFTHAALGKLVLASCRTRLIGKENLPRSGGYIVAGNHVSYLDPVLLWFGMRKPIHMIAKQELFDTPVIGWGLRRLWAFPIKRGTADREAIRRATGLLERGETVGIFPEGSRRRGGEPGNEPGDAHAGVALIAMRANVPVAPCGIHGTGIGTSQRRWLLAPPRVTLRFGEPVHPEAFAQLPRAERLAAMTAEIMRRIGQEYVLAGGR